MIKEQFFPTTIFPLSSLSNEIRSEVTSNPLPKTCGKESAIIPTNKPPRQVFRGTGIDFSLSNSISTKLRDLMNIDAARPVKIPSIM